MNKNATMNDEQYDVLASGVSCVLNNTGGPASRKVSQDVYSDFLANANVGISEGIYYLIIPAHVNDHTDWLNQLAQQEGYADLEEAVTKISLPAARSMVLEDKNIPTKKLSNKQLLFMALVLAKCNQVLYNPHMPLVLTQRRLERKIRLVTIQQTAFYGLDK
jgi:hypothetical protein